MTDSTMPSGAAGNGRPALARCLCIPTDEFAAAYWSQQPLLSPAASLPADFADLFGPDAVDELLSERGLRTPFLRLAKEGRVLRPADFTRGGGLGATVGDQVADDKVLALLTTGATVVLQGLHRVWPPLVDFAQQLSTDLGHPVQVNAYVTPPQSRGFDAHYDVHDVIVLQVAGTKRWTIHPPVHDHPLADQPWTDHREAVAAQAKQPPVIDTVLGPGDALYLPRGWLHSAEALGDTTIHLTVGIHATTRFDLVQRLVALAADSPELRASLPMGLDAEDGPSLQAELDATVKALVARLGDAQVDDAADAVRRRADQSTRPEPLHVLAQMEAIAALTADSWVRLRRHAQARLEDRVQADGSDQAWRLRTSVGSTSWPARYRPALAALLDGRPHRVGDLPVSGDDLTLVRALLSDGIVVPA